MTIERHNEQVGVDVHFSPDECELFVRLASDLEKLHTGSDALDLHPGSASYFSLSAELGKRIRALTQRS
jgi:hypothetical protein